SSVPGSVSKMTFLDAHAGTASKVARINAAMKRGDGGELNRENPDGEIFIVGGKIRRCSLASGSMSVKSNSVSKSGPSRYEIPLSSFLDILPYNQSARPSG